MPGTMKHTWRSPLKVLLKIWRQDNRDADGKLVNYPLDDVDLDMSFSDIRFTSGPSDDLHAVLNFRDNSPDSCMIANHIKEFRVVEPSVTGTVNRANKGRTLDPVRATARSFEPAPAGCQPRKAIGGHGDR